MADLAVFGPVRTVLILDRSVGIKDLMYYITAFGTEYIHAAGYLFGISKQGSSLDLHSANHIFKNVIAKLEFLVHDSPFFRMPDAR